MQIFVAIIYYYESSFIIYCYLSFKLSFVVNLIQCIERTMTMYYFLHQIRVHIVITFPCLSAEYKLLMTAVILTDKIRLWSHLRIFTTLLFHMNILVDQSYSPSRFHYLLYIN